MVNPRRTFKVILTILILGVVAAWIKFLFTPVITDDQGLKYTVREGSSIRAVIDDLYIQNLVNHPLFFRLLVRLKGVTHELKAGEYLFLKGSTPNKILNQITTGSGMVYHSFTIVPGSNFKDLRSAFSQDPYLRHTIQNLSDTAVMKLLGHSELHPEGWFFPDTYHFAEGSPDTVILKLAFKAMQEKLNTAWSQRSSDVIFKNSYEALIAASIIEKEAYIEDELPKIAGVMMNRLKKDMLLQFDPTVIYGAGRFDGKINRTDLLADNPYNTYKHKGLPPTPISMPGMAAIQATMHPMKHDYYYFVAKSNGSSVFTSQLSEHNQAVAAARKEPAFFNAILIRFYLLKLFSHTSPSSSMVLIKRK